MSGEAAYTDDDRRIAADIFGRLDDVGDEWNQQVEAAALLIGRARRRAQIEQLREAARVLTDRADVMERGR